MIIMPVLVAVRHRDSIVTASYTASHGVQVVRSSFPKLEGPLITVTQGRLLVYQT
jgi:hypothetical protein